MRKILIGLVVGLLLGSATMAVASIPDAQGVISACRNKSSGAVRLIDTALKQTCTKTEAAISWNRTGPAGPVGAQGPAGEAGSSPAYVAVRDPRNGPIEFSPLTETTRVIQTFEDVEPGWYTATAVIGVGGAPAGSRLTCTLNGGSEENFWAGDTGSAPSDEEGIKLQTTLRVTDQPEFPVIVRCTATGLGADEAIFITQYQVTLVGFEPVILSGG